MRSDYDRSEVLKHRGETRAWLGIVFLRILILNEQDRKEMCEELTKALADYAFMPSYYTGTLTIENLPEILDDLLWHPRKERKELVKRFDKVCEELLCMDFFGTEGQSDPRGDHRS